VDKSDIRSGVCNDYNVRNIGRLDTQETKELRCYFVQYLALSLPFHCSPLFLTPPLNIFLYPQGQVEYKARPILATLYSMREINPSTHAIFDLACREWAGKVVPTPKLLRHKQVCGDFLGQYLLLLLRLSIHQGI
jgi:hypothetical protein